MRNTAMFVAIVKCMYTLVSRRLSHGESGRRDRLGNNKLLGCYGALIRVSFVLFMQSVLVP